MELTALYAISPVDGRYRSKTSPLAAYFSEFALIRYRLMVEAEYFIALTEIPLPALAEFPAEGKQLLRNLYNDFTHESAEEIKATERVTNHDVKAVEYFVKSRMDAAGLGAWREYVHFGLTSQDVNNTAQPAALRDAVWQVVVPALESIRAKLASMAVQWKDVPMLARTHGQPASPTRLGKELTVFVERIENQLTQLSQLRFSGKFGGATGNFNAHVLAYPDVYWPGFADAFLSDKLGLQRQQTTTQIEHYDDQAAIFDLMRRMNTILIDLCRDIWLYIMLDYFKQAIKAGEVGSSAMPHKVNPIDFENAEGNLGIANAIFSHLAEKLPVSRLQRDLTDSTVTRNTGVPFAHSLIAYDAILRGLNKLIINEKAINDDLSRHAVVIAEGIQTVLRREGIANAYELLRDLTRTNEAPGMDDLLRFIDQLPVNETVKQELRRINPSSYTGINPLDRP
ncbi:MAG TPA: adenylosuccinate lyase [Bacteroidales bacterium]|nr:adenylosuccinate lyase [Bacteroidales bacterium]